jgi:hypothetical protein
MTDKQVAGFITDDGTYVPILAHDNLDGSFSFEVYNNASSVTVLAAADADLTQLITVTTSGVAVQGPDKTNIGGWILKADPNNSGNVWYMYHGQTKALKGFPLAVGESTYASILNLDSLDFDSDANGGKIHAAKA